MIARLSQRRLMPNDSEVLELIVERERKPAVFANCKTVKRRSVMPFMNKQKNSKILDNFESGLSEFYLFVD